MKKISPIIALSMFAIVAVNCSAIPNNSATKAEKIERLEVQHYDTISNELKPNPTVSTPAKIQTVSAKKDTYFNVPMSKDLQDFVFEKSKEYGVEKELIFSLIDIESNYNPEAISDTGDYGLMQVNEINLPKIEQKLGEINLLNPYDNINAGTMILADLVQKSDNLHVALVRYNCGESGAEKLFEQGIYSTSYSYKIINKMNDLKGVRE